LSSASPGTETHRDPRVVIGHDFAETYGGAERTIAAAAELYADAPLWTILGRRSVGERMGVGDRFHTLLPEWGPLLRHYRLLAPLFPAIVGSRRLPEADVLLTSSYAFAHGMRTKNDAPQVCFCHSPLRFAWSMTEEYGGQVARGRLRRAAFRAFSAWMRRADRRAARRVTRYIAASQHVADQLRRFYGVDPDVVHPPVDCELFHPADTPGHDDYFLFSSRLIEPYKRPTLAVEAFRGFPGRLVIAGDGPAAAELRAVAPDNVEFAGNLEQTELRSLMQRCAAVVFPSRDDFGLIPLEAAACGRPAIAFGGGGALETVVSGVTGELFGEQTVPSLRAALEAFDPDDYDPARMRAHAEGFGVPRFKQEIARIVAETAGPQAWAP
jgi:glycosyltransferase involved in cell wall biosynthesis